MKMNVREQLIQIWINRVQLKMIVEETSVVSFVIGDEELDFIINNVIPEINRNQYQASIEDINSFEKRLVVKLLWI